jgi:hypothetical protein
MSGLIDSISSRCLRISSLAPSASRRRRSRSVSSSASLASWRSADLLGDAALLVGLALLDLGGDALGFGGHDLAESGGRFLAGRNRRPRRRPRP